MGTGNKAESGTENRVMRKPVISLFPYLLFNYSSEYGISLSRLPILIVITLAVSAVFYFMGRNGRRRGNEQAASICYSVFFILLLAAIILIVLYLFLSSNSENLLYDD